MIIFIGPGMHAFAKVESQPVSTPLSKISIPSVYSFSVCNPRSFFLNCTLLKGMTKVRSSPVDLFCLSFAFPDIITSPPLSFLSFLFLSHCSSLTSHSFIPSYTQPASPFDNAGSHRPHRARSMGHHPSLDGHRPRNRILPPILYNVQDEDLHGVQ